MAQNFSRYFTLEEARAALPEVVSKLEAVQRIRGELSELAAEMEGMGGGDGDEKPARLRLREQLSRVTLLVEELSATGILVRNLETGLIDFPSRSGDDDIFLCYQLGEVDIRYWHHVYDGFAGRKPL